MSSSLDITLQLEGDISEAVNMRDASMTIPAGTLDAFTSSPSAARI